MTWGGVAQIAAVRAPERFSGLVLTNAVCYDSWPIPSVKMMQRLAPALALLPEVMMYPSFVQLLQRGHDDQQRARESIGVHWAPYVAHGAAPSMMRQMAALDARDTLDVSDRLSAIRENRVDFDPKLAALLALAREAASNVGTVQDSTWQAALDAGWTDTELTELSVHVKLNLFTNYFNHLVNTDLDVPAAPGL